MWGSYLLLSTRWPVTGAGVQRGAALRRIHAGAERRFRFMVMELGLCGVFRTCLSCDEAESEFFRNAHDWSDLKVWTWLQNISCYPEGFCSPCSPTEATLVVLSTHSSTAAPLLGVWTDGWGLSHRCPVTTAVCRLEQEPSLSELLKASFWECALQGNFLNFCYYIKKLIIMNHILALLIIFFIFTVDLDLYLSTRCGCKDPEADWFK